MTNETFKDIEKLESDLWEAADNLRANSKLTSSDYFMPELGVIFLRHSANRFEERISKSAARILSGYCPTGSGDCPCSRGLRDMAQDDERMVT